MQLMQIECTMFIHIHRFAGCHFNVLCVFIRCVAVVALSEFYKFITSSCLIFSVPAYFRCFFFSSFVRFFDNSLLRWAVQIIYQRVQFKMELVSLSQRNKKQLFLLIWNGIICLTTHLNSTIEDGRKKKSDRRWFSLLVMFMDIWFDIRYDRRT